MFEDKDANCSPSQNNESESSCSSFIRRASQACAAGDEELGLHLYLAAYEKGASEEGPLDNDAAFALRKAWMIAIKLKERSLAEHIFEKMEPLLEPHELAVCAGQLQTLALEKLKEFGLSREDLEEVTDMISQDIRGLGVPGMMKVEHMTLPSGRNATIRHESVKLPARKQETADVSDAAPQPPAAKPDGADELSPYAAPTDAASNGDGVDPAFVEVPIEGEPAQEAAAPVEAAETMQSDAAESLKAPASASSAARESMRGDDAPQGRKTADDPDAHAVLASLENITYSDTPGYRQTVQTMRDFGIGMQDDPQFQSLVTMLNKRHGLERMPAADSFLFRAPAREDAHRFMVATLGELGLPALRMHMEENLQGTPVLCVMAQADNHPRLNASRNSFEGPGVLMLEDLDLWEAPAASADDEFGAFLYASLSRGAREAINLIRSAVENPDVYVLASASDMSQVDGFFFDLLEPLTVVDIDNPSIPERRDVWMSLMQEHPSLRGNDLTTLVSLSDGMPRYDIYMAAREAIEEAYKLSLMQRSYVPVTRANLYEKLAAYQPLDSNEYKALENAVIREFGRGLDGTIDDLLER